MTGSRAALAAILVVASVAGAHAEATDPDTCREIWDSVGLPEIHKDLDSDDFVEVCHDGYIALHNHLTRTPDWVIERVTAEMVTGDNARPDASWRQEQAAPVDRRARDSDYTKSGFSRGHQAPSANFKHSVETMKDTFVFSNAVPQVGAGFNSGAWSTLEARIRAVAESRGELVVITGPIYQPEDGGDFVIEADDNLCGSRIVLPALPQKTICKANNRDSDDACEEAVAGEVRSTGVAVPAALFKIVYDPERKRLNAFVMPNVDHGPLKGRTPTREYIKRFRTTLEFVEERTGYRFLTALDDRDRTVVAAHCTGTFFH